MDVSACRSLLSQAWDGIVFGLPAHVQLNCDLCLIHDMADDEIIAWVDAIINNGLTLSYSSQPHGTAFHPCLR